jgi:hypothetical protein
MYAFFGASSYQLGTTRLSIPIYLIDNNETVDLDANAANMINIFRDSTRAGTGVEHRTLQQTGTSKVLVVKLVGSNGDAPNVTMADLSDSIFGNDNTNTVTLVSAELLTFSKYKNWIFYNSHSTIFCSC